MMKKIKKILVLLLISAVFSACAAQKPVSEIVATQESSNENPPVEEKTQPETTPVESAAMARPLLLRGIPDDSGVSVTPCVESYTVEPDLSNVDNLWQFYLAHEMKSQLSQNGFIVSGEAGNEFFEIYESNRYAQIPSFVTVDSLMHTYHLYFSYLLKNIERDYLAECLTQLGERMLENSAGQYEQLKGSEWESAALRNVAFFATGVKLLDENAQIPANVEETVLYELDCIRQAGGIYQSAVTGEEEDYTQYIPRGYYAGDAALEQYFQAMMWYGRIHFEQSNEDLDRSALLISKALSDDSEAFTLWESIYAVTSFFAGASDDSGVCEYVPVIREVYGENVTLQDLIGNEEDFGRFHTLTGTLKAPRINSLPIYDGEDNVIPGFRFMGQRFTVDAAVMQKLIYSNVEENAGHERRMLPDVLDVPAALGSDLALEILYEDGAADYPGYTENMNTLRQALAGENKALWSASLYAGWLNTLRPLLDVKGEGYPMFMQNEEWMKKNLECFAGSFTELKHDTVLYSKQVMAEMGGGYDEEEPDDRGYVESEPQVYARFSVLAEQTAAGLKEYGMLASQEEENLSRLSQMADTLLAISNKELQDETLTDEEYEFIRCYGGNLEHFWREAVKEGSDYVCTQECPAAIVVDIATDPNGTVLEAATGNPSTIYVAVKVDGKIKIATGSVYSFYQFPWPMQDRLTDSAWRQMMGIQYDDNGNYSFDTKIAKPQWTDSYRY